MSSPCALYNRIQAGQNTFHDYFKYGKAYGLTRIVIITTFVASLIFLTLGVLSFMNVLKDTTAGSSFLCVLGGVGIIGTLLGTRKMNQIEINPPPGVPARGYHFWNVAQTARDITAAHANPWGMKFGEEYGKARAMAVLLLVIAAPFFGAGVGSLFVQKYTTTITGFSVSITLISLSAFSHLKLNAIKRQVNLTRGIDLNERFYSEYLRRIFAC